MPAYSLTPVLALLASAAVVLVGNGLQGMIVPLKASLDGFTTREVAFLSSAYSLGFILSCLVTPHMLQRVGHIRTFAVMASVAASVVLVLALLVHPWLWIAFRVLTGFCFAGMFMVIESWLNATSDNANRGRVFATYMIVNLGAVMIGQMLLPLGDPAGMTLFVLTGIAITLSLVPLCLTTSQAPKPIAHVRLRLKRLYAASPVGVAGCLAVGAANGAIGGLAPLFAERLGLSLTAVAGFMSAGILGGALGQIPLGRLSDRTDRRRVLAAACLVASLIGAVLAVAGGAAGAVAGFGEASPGALAIIGLYGVLGAFVYSLYSLCVAHTNDYVAAEDFVETSSGLLLTYGIGAVAGPALAAPLMNAFGVGALFAFTAAVHLGFCLFALYRMTRRASVPPEERAGLPAEAGVAQRTTPALAALDPRAPDDARASDDPPGALAA